MLGRLWQGGTADKWRAASLLVCPLLGVVGLTLIFWRLDPAINEDKGWSTSDTIAAVGGGILVIVVSIALFNIVASPHRLSGMSWPSRTPAQQKGTVHRDMRTRWRLLWIVGLIGVALPAGMHAAFALNDDYRRDNAAASLCLASSADEEAEATAPTTSVAASTDSPVPPADGPDTAAIAQSALMVTVDLGFERNVRSEFAELQVVGEGGADTIKKTDFRVISSDRRGSSGFVCLGNVFAISPTRALAEVVVDAGRRSGLEGGTLEGQIVYTGPLELVNREIGVEANLQSRAVYYLLALIPVIVLLAMYPVFDMWPPNLKRWWTSILAVGAPVVATYFAAGLSNATWSLSAAALGKLLAGSYGAGAAAAIAAKGAAHDLHDTSEEEGG